MVLSDSLVGHYLQPVWGWVFLFVVVLAECILLSKYLRNNWYSSKVFKTVFISNIVSGFICFVAMYAQSRLDSVHDLGVMIASVPVYVDEWEIKPFMTIVFLLQHFIIFLFIELILNYFLLKKKVKTRKLVYGTIGVNAISFVFWVVVFFSYMTFSLTLELKNMYRESVELCSKYTCTEKSFVIEKIYTRSDISNLKEFVLETYKKGSRFEQSISKTTMAFANKEWISTDSLWAFSVNGGLRPDNDYIFYFNTPGDATNEHSLSGMQVGSKLVGRNCSCFINQYRANNVWYSTSKIELK
jgi:hypothetical protein